MGGANHPHWPATPCVSSKPTEEPLLPACRRRRGQADRRYQDCVKRHEACDPASRLQEIVCFVCAIDAERSLGQQGLAPRHEPIEGFRPISHKHGEIGAGQVGARRNRHGALVEPSH